MSSTQERPVPPRGAAARRAAAEAGGVVAESGTGSGVGTAWLHSGLAADARLVTVERDPELARRAAGLLTDDPRVQVLTGDWRLLEQHAPFDAFFCDGGPARRGNGRGSAALPS